ncbi:MAG: hypothetical protein LBB72_04365 [Spirochaetaceae bacterium]|jgi:hypothetical protein|nr:hypothetical protein [Spirochaetaceae bacterium]
MLFFCFLWIPLFYLFWRSLNGDQDSGLEGGTWALIIGTIVALFRFFFGSFVHPEGFGLARWVSACIDVVALPAALPFIVGFIFAAFHIISSQGNFTHYAFLWIIPVAAVRALGWSSQSNPLLFMIVPVLWTAVITGIGFFIRLIQNNWGWIVIPAILGAVALPLAAATAYWAFFAQNSILGIVFMVVSFVPMAVSLIMSFVEGRGANRYNIL